MLEANANERAETTGTCEQFLRFFLDAENLWVASTLCQKAVPDKRIGGDGIWLRLVEQDGVPSRLILECSGGQQYIMGPQANNPKRIQAYAHSIVNNGFDPSRFEMLRNIILAERPYRVDAHEDGRIGSGFDPVVEDVSVLLRTQLVAGPSTRDLDLALLKDDTLQDVSIPFDLSEEAVRDMERAFDELLGPNLDETNAMLRIVDSWKAIIDTCDQSGGTIEVAGISVMARGRKYSPIVVVENHENGLRANLTGCHWDRAQVLQKILGAGIVAAQVRALSSIITRHQN